MVSESERRRSSSSSCLKLPPVGKILAATRRLSGGSNSVPYRSLHKLPLRFSDSQPLLHEPRGTLALSKMPPKVGSIKMITNGGAGDENFAPCRTNYRIPDVDNTAIIKRLPYHNSEHLTNLNKTKKVSLLFSSTGPAPEKGSKKIEHCEESSRSNVCNIGPKNLDTRTKRLNEEKNPDNANRECATSSYSSGLKKYSNCVAHGSISGKSEAKSASHDLNDVNLLKTVELVCDENSVRDNSVLTRERYLDIIHKTTQESGVKSPIYFSSVGYTDDEGSKTVLSQYTVESKSNTYESDTHGCHHFPNKIVLVRPKSIGKDYNQCDVSEIESPSRTLSRKQNIGRVGTVTTDTQSSETNSSYFTGISQSNISGSDTSRTNSVACSESLEPASHISERRRSRLMLRKSSVSSYGESSVEDSSGPKAQMKILLNEDITCTYVKSKVSSLVIDGVVQVHLNPESTPEIPFELNIIDPSLEIKEIYENVKYAKKNPASCNETNHSYIVSVKEVGKYLPIAKYRCHQELRPVPIRVQTVCSTRGKKSQVALQVCVNPRNKGSLSDVNILMAVPPNVKGESVKTFPAGGAWDSNQGCVVWTLHKLRRGDKFQVQAQFELEFEDDEKIPHDFPVLVRCICKNEHLSDIAVCPMNFSNHSQEKIKASLVKRFRLSHREKGC